MFCIPIIGPRLQDVMQQIGHAISLADMIEFRIDLFHPEVYPHLLELRKKITLPIIFKGGEAFVHCAPTYIDSETAGDIISYHDFEKTPDDLEAVLKQMPKGQYQKIACKANSTNDALKMVLFTKKHPHVLGMCMGEQGLVTRLLGAPWRYAALSKDHQSAPDQPTLEELKIYGSTRHLYGLIGGSVSQSPSHITHNKLMQTLGLDACYLKMLVQPAELKEFFCLAKQVRFKGLSVTIPLKEKVIPFLDKIETDAGAVNTITIEDGKLIGSNTDGMGALAALPSGGKTAVVLGAGGAAKAIVAALEKEGITAHVLNRSLETAAWAKKKGHLADLRCLNYDILINTTPSSLPIDPNDIIPQCVVMDINLYPTELIRLAEDRGCKVVLGMQMFIQQAARQFEKWFGVSALFVAKELQTIIDQLDVSRKVS